MTMHATMCQVWYVALRVSDLTVLPQPVDHNHQYYYYRPTMANQMHIYETVLLNDYY